MRAIELARHRDIVSVVYQATMTGAAARSLPATMDLDTIATLDGGRLPLGVGSAGARALPVHYHDRVTVTVWVAQHTDRVVDLRWSEVVDAVVNGAVGAVPLDRPVVQGAVSLPASVSGHAAQVARTEQTAHNTRTTRHALAVALFVLAAVALLAAAVLAVFGRRRPAARPGPMPPARIPASASANLG